MDIVELPHDLFLLVLGYLSPRDAVLCRRVSRKWRAAFTDPDISLTLLKWNFPRSREMRLIAAAAAVRSEDRKRSTSPANLPLEVQLELEEDTEKDWAGLFASLSHRYHNLQTASPRVVEKIETEKQYHIVAPWNRYLRLNERNASFHFPDPGWSYSQEDGLLVYRAPRPSRPNNSKDNVAHNHTEASANHAYAASIAVESVDGVSADNPAEASPNDVTVETRKNNPKTDDYSFWILDLATRREYRVPFNAYLKIVRRVRLADGVLIIEWCEQFPYHHLNAREWVHRHYATAFDVVRERYKPVPSSNSTSEQHSFPRHEKATRPEDESWRLSGQEQTPEQDDSPPPWSWKITFRSEWKIHFLGFPLNVRDRFFSTHTSTHYAIYVWQPNRGPWGEDDPIESLTVWDISQPLDYRPSDDPIGKKRPHGSGREQHASSQAGSSTPVNGESHLDGPTIIRRLTWHDLEFYRVRQRNTPKLRSLALDDRNLYIVEEEHRWAVGNQSSLNPPRVHQVKCTAIPVIPATPAQTPLLVAEVATPSQPPTTTASASRPRPPIHHTWFNPARSHRGAAPNANANVNNAGETPPQSKSIPNPVAGPRWVDECGADGDVNMSFCWRARIRPMMGDGAPRAIPIVREPASWTTNCDADAGDPPATTAAAAGTALTSPSVWGGLTHNHGGTTATTSDPTWISGRGCGGGLSSARWPGWAPCWRHENFPYLTVSEMVDFAAGVRVMARQCFMLETVSVHVRPALCVRGIVTSGAGGHGQSAGESREEEDEEEIDDDDDDDDAAESNMDGPKVKKTKAGGGGGPDDEVQFADELWEELLGKGHIAGDERWLVGEDGQQRITVVRF